MHLRRLIACAVIAAMATSACSGSGDDPAGPGASAPSEQASGACTDASPSEADLGDVGGEIEQDEDVDVRELDNGLTVYVRENDSPGQRGSMSLVVRAGSVLEDEERTGVAHFLEHMLFNGTKEFPGNELVQELERFGSAIGPDLNAYTSYDETVYMLELPDVSRDTRELAVTVLHEWAANATIEQDDVEDERGVVEEERRGATESGQGRVGLEFEEVALAGTPYEGTSTIGSAESIESMDREPLVEFYESWYRPEHMAIVAVGDFDGDDMHELIEEQFADLPEGEGPERPDLDVEPWSEPVYHAIVEPELASAYGSIGFTTEAPDLATGLGRREALLPEVALAIIATRLEDGISRGDVPLTEASASTAFPVAGLLGPSLDFTVPSDELRPSIEAVLEEMERACRFGFTDSELERALEERRAAAEQEHELVDSKQDGSYAADYRASYLTGATAQAGDDAYDLQLALLDSITAEDVTAWFADQYARLAPSIVVAGTDEDDVPDDDELAALVEAATDLELEEAEDVDTEGLELLEPPEAVEPERRTDIEAFDDTRFPAVRLQYANGAEVVIQSTDIAAGSITLQASSPGGLSVLAGEDVAAGQLLAGELTQDVITQSGAGDLDQVQLDRLLADRSVELGLLLEAEEEKVHGSASSEDAETLLQLTHLYLSEPKVTDAALRSALGEVRPVAEDPATVPQIAQIAALGEARFGDEPRYRFLPDAAALDTVTTEQAQAVAQDRFGSGGDFSFALVGDVELDELERLASTYLGTLPDGGDEEWEDVMAPAPPGVVERTVHAGSGDQGSVAFLYSFERPIDGSTMHDVELLRAVVDTRLREVIREELGATYSPNVHAEATDLPRGLVYFLILVDGDPATIDEVSAAIERELAALAAGEFSTDELERAIETVATDYELWNNELLAETHLTYLAHPAWPISDFLARDGYVRSLDQAALTELAASVFDAAQHVEVRLLPAES